MESRRKRQQPPHPLNCASLFKWVKARHCCLQHRHMHSAHCMQLRKLRHTSRHNESYKLRPNKQHLLQTCVTCSYLGQCLLVTALHREHSRHITDSNRAAPAAAAASTAASAATAATLLHSLCRWQP